MRKVLELVLIGVFGMMVGAGVTAYYWNEDIRDFKVDAVMMEVGFWDINGDFDWKQPELTMMED